ncbi:hypothetical protein KGF57_003285 [Candida theae]|uniref:RRM domain-containing protein n=1 Tax=Candida theae TaxID=1198502 RepID=A0AAD5FXZ7_9ASCO|nr:uncharacterized protein KGF57_003285 [Candida theae]KAI5957591.1 hypothetical protein KGF57_003285 [Candida theae]
MSQPSINDYSRRGNNGDTNRLTSAAARSGSSIRERDSSGQGYTQPQSNADTHSSQYPQGTQGVRGDDRSSLQAYAYRDRGKERVAEVPVASSLHRKRENQPELPNVPSSYYGRERYHGTAGPNSYRGPERYGGPNESRSYRGSERYNAPNHSGLQSGESYRPRSNNKRRYAEHQGDSYRPNQPRRRDQFDPNFHRDEPNLNEQVVPTRPVSKMSKAEIEASIQKLENHLASLSDVPPLNQIKVIDSRWGVKAKGFEKVSAPRAKLSGLFPLPGFPRPVDFTKLEGLVKDRLSNSDDILNETSRIDPVDSRVAKILIITGIESINYLKIVEFFNDYLRMIDFEQSSSNNIHSKRKLKDDKTLIIEFNNSECATIIYSLNGTELLFNAYKEDSVARRDVSDKFRLQISRPNEYVVQDEGDLSSGEVQEVVKDSPRKISLIVSPNVSSDNAKEQLEKLAPLAGMQYLRQKGTKEPLGLIFVKFKHADAEIIEKLKSLPFATNAFYSCLSSPETPVQTGPIDYYTLPKLANNELVRVRASSKVVQLINAVSIRDLTNDSNVKFLHDDMKAEASKFGNVVSIKIPCPANDFTPGLQQLNVAGLGKVFIEFGDEDAALKAIMELSGRSYNDRTVLATHYDYEDFKKNII